MIYDLLDFFIIQEFYKAALKKEETTTWQMAKKFLWLDKPQNMSDSERDDFLTNKMNLIRSRIKAMSSEELIKVEKGEKNNSIFTLLGDKVLLCKHKFNNGYKDSIQIKGKDQKWAIFEL